MSRTEPVRGWYIAKDEEFDETSNQNDDRELTENEALRKGKAASLDSAGRSAGDAVDHTRRKRAVLWTLRG